MNTKPAHGQPIDYFELEQHRLHHLANSMTLAITEGFGEYVDTREWEQDDPSFGFGRVGSPILYTSLNDRDDGKYLPIYQTQMDLAAIRAEARNVTAMSGGVVGAIGTLSNYTLGGGLKFTAQQSQSCPQNLSPDAVAALVAEAQRMIDRFLRENKFQSDMDREVDRRTREDGEAFVELSVSPAGQIRASFDEPDMICQPFNPAPIEDWLRDQDYQRYSPEWTWSWSFGIHCIRRTPDDPLGYHVVYDTTGDDWEYVPASRMLHVKANFPRNVKRGVSDLYWIANDVQREAKIRRNTADGAALQAAIAWFREHAQGTTTSAVQSIVDRQAIDIRQQRTSSGTRPTKQGKLHSGTVVDIPETMKVLPGPMGSERNSNFILIAQYVARAIAARWAMPEFMFTSDASNANYASTLVAESPFVKAREADQRFYGQAFVELLWKVLRLAHEIGRAFPNIEKFDDLQQILELTATGPRVSNRDELQTVQRQQIEVSMGTLSLETAAAEMGRDLAKEQAKGARPKDGVNGASTQSNDDQTLPGQASGSQGKNQQGPVAECSNHDENVSTTTILRDVIAAMTLLLEQLAERSETGASPENIQSILQEIAVVKARAANSENTKVLQTPVMECGGKGGTHGPCKTTFKDATVPRNRTATNQPQGSAERVSTDQYPLGPGLSPGASGSKQKTMPSSVNNPVTKSAASGGKSKPKKGKQDNTTRNPKSTPPPDHVTSDGSAKLRKSNPNTRIRQRYAHAIQKHVAKGLNGTEVGDNAPSDVVFHSTDGRHHNIEVKGLLDRKTQDIRMTRGAIDRKAKVTADSGNDFHTVVVDRRSHYKRKQNDGANYSGYPLYYKRGGGSHRLDQMHKVKDFEELKTLIAMDEKDLPESAKPTAKWKETVTEAKTWTDRGTMRSSKAIKAQAHASKKSR